MTQSGPPEAQVHPPKPGALRLGRGILPSPEQMHEQWSWQRPDWPQFQWDWERLVEPLGKARLALGRLQMAGSVLEPRAAQEVLAEVLALEGVSSSAIEGEMINPASMAASVARHLGLPVESGAPWTGRRRAWQPSSGTPCATMAPSLRWPAFADGIRRFSPRAAPIWP